MTIPCRARYDVVNSRCIRTRAIAWVARILERSGLPCSLTVRHTHVPVDGVLRFCDQIRDELTFIALNPLSWTVMSRIQEAG